MDHVWESVQVYKPVLYKLAITHLHPIIPMLNANLGDLIALQMARVVFNYKYAQTSLIINRVIYIRIHLGAIWQSHAYLNLNNVVILLLQPNVIIIQLLAKLYRDADGIKKQIYVYLLHASIYHSH